MLTLRDYQLDAVDAVDPDDTRALLVSGCGTGKTLMALHAVAKLLADAPATVLLTFPTLGLLEQTYQVWRAEAPMPFSALAVCSQQISDAEDIADDDVLDELQIDDPLELTGLYDGIPLTEKSVSEPQHFPDTVWLFRRAILDEWVERGNVTLTELVAHVVVHELAHHFGWSDEDVARIDRWWE